MKNGKEKFKNNLKLRIYNWTLRLIRVIDKLSKENSSQILGKQLIRSGTSIGANYIEAQAASSKKDFANFLHYSLKSANESKFWISLLKDSNKLNREDANKLLDELIEISNILGSSLITIKKNK